MSSPAGMPFRDDEYRVLSILARFTKIRSTDLLDKYNAESVRWFRMGYGRFGLIVAKLEDLGLLEKWKEPAPGFKSDPKFDRLMYKPTEKAIRVIAEGL